MDTCNPDPEISRIDLRVLQPLPANAARHAIWPQYPWRGCPASVRLAMSPGQGHARKFRRNRWKQRRDRFDLNRTGNPATSQLAGARISVSCSCPEHHLIPYVHRYGLQSCQSPGREPLNSLDARELATNMQLAAELSSRGDNRAPFRFTSGERRKCCPFLSHGLCPENGWVNLTVIADRRPALGGFGVCARTDPHIRNACRMVTQAPGFHVRRPGHRRGPEGSWPISRSSPRPRYRDQETLAIVSGPSRSTAQVNRRVNAPQSSENGRCHDTARAIVAY